MSTIKEDILSEASTIFLDRDEFAEDVVFMPHGKLADSFSALAIVDMDSLPGSNEVRGDGRVQHKKPGTRIRKSVMIECLTTLNIREHRSPKDAIIVFPSKTEHDLFTASSDPDFSLGDKYVLKRMMGRDAGMTTWLYVATLAITEGENNRVG